MGHTESAVQMLVHDDVATGEGAAPAYLVDLQGQVLEADGVVAADRTLELEREDASTSDVGRAFRQAASKRMSEFSASRWAFSSACS